MNHKKTKSELNNLGYSSINQVYTKAEIDNIIECLGAHNTENVFAIRQLIKELPDLKRLIFNNNLIQLIEVSS